MMDFPRRAASRRRVSRADSRGGVRRSAAAAAIVAAGAFLSAGLMVAHVARADDWAAYRGDLLHSGVASEKVQPPLAVQWRFTAGPQAGNDNPPAVVGDTVYFTTRASVRGGGVLFALDTKTGAQRWRTNELPSQQLYTTAPLVDNGRVYVGASDGRLYIYDAANGNSIVQFRTGRSIESAPIISSGTLYFGSNDGIFRAVDPQTGASVWRQTFRVPDGINSSPIMVGSLIYFTTNSNSVYCINSATGIQKWANRLQFQAHPNTAIYADNTIYIPAGPRLHAIQPTSGNFRWARDFPADVMYSPVSSEGTIYVVDDNKNLWAVRSSNGRDVWKKPVALPYSPSAAPILSGNTLYIPTSQSILLAVSKDDGSVLWQYRMEGSVDTAGLAAPKAPTLTAPVAISGGSIYVVSDDGSLTAFRSDATDASAPLAGSMYPPQGSSVNGSPGLIIAATIADPGSGLNPATVKLSLDSKALEAKYDPTSELIYYRTRSTGKIIDPALSDGRHSITLIAKDFMGNTLTQNWFFNVDNSLPQSQPATTTPGTRPATTPGRPGGGFPGGPGGGFPGGGFPGGGFPGGGFPGGGFPGGGRGRGR